MHIFHTLFTRFKGGLEQAFVNDTEAFAKSGHTATACVRPDAPYLKDIQDRATATHTVRPRGFYDLAAAWKIRRLLKRAKPDVMIGNNGRAVTMLYYASRGLRIPLIGVTHSYQTERMFTTDMLIVLSEHMKQHFLDAGYKKPLVILPNLMHLPERKPFKTPSDPLIIGGLGRFSPEKGFADLLDAFYELKQSGVNFVAKIAGGGNELDNLKALQKRLGLESNVEWLGWITDKDAFYRGLDMLCIPSHEDSLPMVVIEALAYGVPLVATDVPGTITMLKQEYSALIVPRRDVKSIAGALRRIATEPGLAEHLASGALTKSQDFHFDTVSRQWNELLKDVPGKARPRQAA